METVNLELFGQDPKVQKAVSTAKNVSVTKAPVLISGEAGVGKRTLANFIHQNSNRPLDLSNLLIVGKRRRENQVLG